MVKRTHGEYRSPLAHRPSAIMTGLTGILLLQLPVAAAAPKVKVSIWGLSSISAGQKRMVEEFNKTHPDIELSMETQVSNFAGQTMEQIAKLVIAITGGVPPAVTTVDRFLVGSVAARGMLMPLDEFIKRDKVNLNGWYKNVLDEARYRGKIYALPSGTDDRALYYNQVLFANVGLDPNAPPETWDQLLAYARKLTKVSGDGKLTQVGFAPLYAQGWLYLWGWQNGAEFLSEDGRKSLLNDPHLVEALSFIVKFYDEFGGYDLVHRSLSGDPFLNQQLAMKIDGNWYLNSLAGALERDFDWFVAPAPVPAERLAGTGRFAGQPKFITWSGGWSWAIPVGVPNPDAAWEVIKFLTTTPGHLANAEGTFEDRQAKKQVYVPGMTGYRDADRQLAEKYLKLLPGKFYKAQMVFIDLLNVTRFRPITPLASELWEAQMKAAQEAAQHKAPPQAVLEDWHRRLQGKLDQYYSKGQLD